MIARLVWNWYHGIYYLNQAAALNWNKEKRKPALLVGCGCSHSNQLIAGWIISVLHLFRAGGKKIKRLSGSNTKGSNPAATRNQERNILCSFSIYFRVRNQRSLRKIGPNDKRRKSRRRRWFSATGNGKQTSLVEMPCILIFKKWRFF